MYQYHYNYLLTECIFVTGNHAIYNLQAVSDDNKKRWINAFQTVFEGLKFNN